MNNTMEYKGYVGSVEFSQKDSLLYGKVLGIRSLVSYEGSSVEELIKDFHEAVDEYLAACAQEGTEPEQAYKGSFNVRLGSDLHRRAVIYALSHGQTLNSLVEEAVREKITYGE
ncbi:MAG: type II toxin-antitoxin system HicB family antitoxin [Lachnospiraceae bacterium]|nr:type II toxin-antitoxin system HicB family antitoxin [Lachnospiraceae bacterium]MBQ6241237.1 type II toxin-antitoxin system HicB family antitoxin [Lachnospiraceae bacterium]